MIAQLRNLGKIISSGLVKRTFVYTLSTGVNSMVAFLILPILTRYLSPHDYGVVETYMIVCLLLTIVLPIGGDALLSKEYFHLESPDREHFAGNVLGMTLLTGLLVFVVVFLAGMFSDLLPSLLKIENKLILVAIITAFANAIISLVMTVYQLEKKAKQYAVFVNSRTITEVSLSLFLIVALGMSWQGRIIGIVFSIILFMVVAVYLLRRRKITFMYPKKFGKQIIWLGTPLVIATVLGWGAEAVGKLFINNMVNVESTGLYSIGLRFAMVVMVLECAFSRAWLPFFFENIQGDVVERNRKIVKATYLYIICLVAFALAYGLVGKQLLYFFIDKRFYAGAQVIFILSMAYCFDGIWKMFIGYLIHAGKTKVYSKIVFISAAVNIVLTYLLLKHMGIIGVAWAMLFSFMVGALLTMMAAQRYHPMPWLFMFSRRMTR